MRDETTQLGPAPGLAREGMRRSRFGIVPTPAGGARRRITLILLSLIGLPWLPYFESPGDARRNGRARGVGDLPILTLAFSPDGATIATIQLDGRVGLREAAQGGEHSFLDHRGSAQALAFAPDGRSLAVGGVETDVFLYDVKSGGPGRPLGIPIRCVCAKGLAFSPDGCTLAASSHLDHDIILWDLAAGREKARLRGHHSPATSLAFAPDGRSLASGSHGDGAVIVWDLATNRPRLQLGAPPRPVIHLAFSPDGRWLASVGDRGLGAKLWDLEDRRRDRPIEGLSQAKDSLAFSPDGRLLAMVGSDGVVRLSDLATGADLRRIGGGDDRLFGVAFSPDGLLLAATSNDSDVRIWSLAEILGTVEGPARPEE